MPQHPTAGTQESVGKSWNRSLVQQPQLQVVLRVIPDRVAVVLILLSIALSLSLAAGIASALLARWDGSSVPTTLAHAGVAFGGTLSLGIAFIALLITAWS